MSLTAAVVIMVVLVIRLLLRKAPKKYSYALWSVAAFRLVCPVSFKSVFSLFTFANRLEEVQIQQTVTTPLPDPDYTFLSTPPDMMGEPIDIDPEYVFTYPLTTPTVEPEPGFNLPEHAMEIAAIVWLIGLAALLIYGVVSYLRLRRRMSTAVRMESNVWQSDRVQSPFILGFVRPKIYLPFGLSADQQRYVLAHERYHIKRFDHIVRPLSFLILAVHWFNPFVWLAYYLMSRDMEMSCDEKVLSGGESVKAYSTTLLSFAANRRFPSPSPLAFGESGVKSRIKNALNWKKPRMWVTVAAVIVCAVVLVACAADPRETETTDGTQPPAATDEAEPPETEEVLAVWQADLTHDGVDETITLTGSNWHENLSQWTHFTVTVTDTAGKTLWVDEADSSHVGWNGIYLCRRSGKAYLMNWVPYGSTGMFDLRYSVFSLTNDGGVRVLVENELSYGTIASELMTLDVADIRAFENEVNALLADAIVLFSNTNNGTAAYSTEGNAITEQFSGYADSAEELQTNFFGDTPATYLLTSGPNEDAEAYAMEQAARLLAESGITSGAAAVLGIEDIDTATVGLTDGWYIYRMRYQLTEYDRAAGLAAEQSVAHIYLCLYAEWSGGSRVWVPMGTLTEEELQQYNTPEMEAMYGGDDLWLYRAAVSQVYQSWKTN